MRREVRGLLVVLGVALLAACGGGGSPVSTSSHTPTPLPVATPTSVQDRCKVPVDGGTLVTLPGPDGNQVPGATFGEGPVVAVLLHQTAPSGFCGWTSYAAWLAHHGVRAVLVDLCGWGRAKCTGAFASDTTAQVKVPVDWARAHGASRVVVVGASMGGAYALGVGQEAGADAVVDLSGPAQWQGVPGAVEAAKATSVPLLVAIWPGDSQMQPAVLKSAVAGSPAEPKRFVPTDGAHGWSMLDAGSPGTPEWTTLAATVLRWVKGDYRAG
jgi:pimeloyl-ACP methyl ester carboxylesterase